MLSLSLYLLFLASLSLSQTFREADKRLWKHAVDEWDREKEKILESLLGPSNQEFPELPSQAEVRVILHFIPLFSLSLSQTLNIDPLSLQGRSALNAVEMAYAREVILKLYIMSSSLLLVLVLPFVLFCSLSCPSLVVLC